MLTLIYHTKGVEVMNCPICNFECNDNDTICKNCGCDLPKKPAATANKQESTPLTPVDLTRNRLLQQEQTNLKIFIALKVMLIASLLCFFIPFARYEFDSILNEDIANGLNAIVGYDYFEAVEIEPEDVTAFSLVFGEEFTASDGTIFEVSRSVYIVLALMFIVAAIAFCFVPMAMDLKMKIVTSLSITALVAVVYQSFQNPVGLSDVKMLIGFYLLFILLLASAAVAAFLKYNS